jgi:hypothetical protein
MTGQPQKESQFNQRADNAALSLKDQLNRERGLNLREQKVEVGPDGQPPKPPPPEGSYARQAYDQMRAEQAAQAAQMMQQQGQQPPVGTQEQALDGSQAPVLPQPTQPPQASEGQDFSPKTQERFAKLTQDLREKDRQLQQVLEQAKHNESTLAETQSAMRALQQQHEQMIQANLDNLDPETRMQVMQDARMRQHLDEFERRILSHIQPQIQGLRANREHDELMQLSGKYPAFDVQIHGPLIEIFRGKNQHASVEQAFKAIAEPEELVTRSAVSATAVPPVVAPRPSYQSNPQSRYIPEPQSDPEQEMREEAAQIGKLMRSMDAADQKAGARLIEKNLADRLGDKLPGARYR